jgi:hypothetical protein
MKIILKNKKTKTAVAVERFKEPHIRTQIRKGRPKSISTSRAPPSSEGGKASRKT